jgi:chloramphenicol-sensitive protein RarD
MGLTSAHLAALLAFSMWGLFPIYWKFFPEVEAWDLFAHRLLWSFFTLTLILLFKRRLGSFKEIWKNKKIRWTLIASAIFISSNWLLYIYAVSNGKILETSMGYFLNPLINVFVGWLILKEKVRLSQWPALILALVAIIWLGIQSGINHFPWIALTLSVTFAAYGLLRKIAHVGSLEGLAFETSMVLIPTVIFWYFRPHGPLYIIEQISLYKILLLSLAGLITCAPLILFAFAAKRLPFGTLGFIGYLSPSLKFICGWLIFDEPLGAEKLQAFMLIWLALVWYTLESFVGHGRANKKKPDHSLT